VSFVAVFSGTSFAAGEDAKAPAFWIGHAERNGATLAFQIRLTAGEPLTGALDIPEFPMLGLPLGQSERKGDRLTLGFGSGRVSHLLEGIVKNGRFEGTWHWTQSDFSCRFTLEEKPDPRPYTAEEVTFKNGDVTLGGTVFVPTTAGSHPAIVMVDGSGDALRWVREGHADFFARRGMVTLIYDKRGCGVSTGNWRQVNFEPLAQDALAGLHLLQARKDVDPKRCGFWGISQAGWIMPLAASMSPQDVAFILTASGAAVDVKTEGKYDYLVKLRDAGFSAEDLAEAEKILDLDHEVTMTGKGYEELRQLVVEAHEKPWWKPFDFHLTPQGARAFPKLIGGFDPRPILEKIDTPILWMYGSADKSVEPSKSIAILNEITSQKPKPWTIKTFEGADHGLRLPYDQSLAFPHAPYAPGYWDTMAQWLKDRGL
jgi:dienelactone hydrolase